MIFKDGAKAGKKFVKSRYWLIFSKKKIKEMMDYCE